MAGVKVWLRYHDHAIPASYYTKRTGFMMPLADILDAPRPPLPIAPSMSAWWNTPGPLQPPAARTWRAAPLRALTVRGSRVAKRFSECWVPAARMSE